MKRIAIALLFCMALPLCMIGQEYTISAPASATYGTQYIFCKGSYLTLPDLPTISSSAIAYMWTLSTGTSRNSSYIPFQNRIMTSSDNGKWIKLKVVEADSSISYSNPLQIFAKSPTPTTTETHVACDQYSWHGVTYSESTTVPVFDTVNNYGCPKTITLNLTINHSSNVTTDVEACDSYTWHGTTYHASVNTMRVGTNTSNCPDTNNLHLIIHYSNTTGMESANVCDSYTWHGNTYTESGNYPFPTQTVHGCDSVCTLYLTVRHSTSSTDVHTTCDSYTWIDGNTYTSSNYTTQYVIYNTQGCDSTVTLNLTVHHSDTLATESANVCDSYMWNNTNYTSSGVYRYQTNTVLGCDSVCTLYLTIRNSTASTDIVTECSQYTWIDGNTYYRDTMGVQYIEQNSAWCDSVITLYLTILEEERPQTRELVVKNLGTGTPQMIIYPRTAGEKEYAYQWYRDNTIIEDAQLQYYRLGSDDNGGHTFSVYAYPIEQRLCGDTSSIELSVSNCAETKLSVSPNPNNGKFEMSLLSPDEHAREIAIYSQTGSIVYESAIQGDMAHLQTSLPTGIYTLFVTTDKGNIYTQKIIVK